MYLCLVTLGHLQTCHMMFSRKFVINRVSIVICLILVFFITSVFIEEPKDNDDDDEFALTEAQDVDPRVTLLRTECKNLLQQIQSENYYKIHRLSQYSPSDLFQEPNIQNFRKNKVKQPVFIKDLNGGDHFYHLYLKTILQLSCIMHVAIYQMQRLSPLYKALVYMIHFLGLEKCFFHY